MLDYKQDELECLFIGSLLRDGNGYLNCGLNYMDFVTVPGKRCFDAVGSLIENSNPVNIQTVAKIAGLDHIEFINKADDHGIKSNLNFLVKEIKERAARNRIKEFSKSVLSKTNSHSSENIMDDIRDFCRTENKTGVENGNISYQVDKFKEAVKENTERGYMGIRSNFTNYCNEMIYFCPGHLWAVGGYTSIGKSAFMIELLCRLNDKVKVAMFSTEMTSNQIINRIVANYTGYSAGLIMAGRVDDKQYHDSVNRLKKTPISIYSNTREFSDIANTIRVLKMQDKIDIAIIDYFQNMKIAGRKGFEFADELAKSLQSLGLELGIPIVVLSQIPVSEFKEDSGGLSYKGAGTLGECCDVGLWLTKGDPTRREILVEMRKNRHGKKVDMLLRYNENYSRLEEQTKTN
jgi:replicative DNA helicase